MNMALNSAWRHVFTFHMAYPMCHNCPYLSTRITALYRTPPHNLTLINTIHSQYINTIGLCLLFSDGVLQLFPYTAYIVTPALYSGQAWQLQKQIKLFQLQKINKFCTLIVQLSYKYVDNEVSETQTGSQTIYDNLTKNKKCLWNNTLHWSPGVKIRWWSMLKSSEVSDIRNMDTQYEHYAQYRSKVMHKVKVCRQTYWQTDRSKDLKQQAPDH